MNYFQDQMSMPGQSEPVLPPGYSSNLTGHHPPRWPQGHNGPSPPPPPQNPPHFDRHGATRTDALSSHYMGQYGLVENGAAGQSSVPRTDASELMSLKAQVLGLTTMVVGLQVDVNNTPLASSHVLQEDRREVSCSPKSSVSTQKFTRRQIGFACFFPNDETLHRSAMLSDLATEIIHIIAECCSAPSQASLSRTCLRLHGIFNRILYKDNVAHSGASCVYHAIARCSDQKNTIATLRIARNAGCDFKQCRSPSGPGLQVFSFPPLYLAATRGLENVVVFLMDNGAPLDGPAGTVATTLLGALLAREEKVSMLLVRRGASLQTGTFCLSALHAAVCAGLEGMVTHLVRDMAMDVNDRTKSGATPVMLAASIENHSMVRILVSLGARLYEALLHACLEHYYSVALQLLEDAQSLSDAPLSRREARDIAGMISYASSSTETVALFRRLVDIAEPVYGLARHETVDRARSR